MLQSINYPPSESGSSGAQPQLFHLVNKLHLELIKTLIYCRKKSFITQSQLARESGLTQSVLARIETLLTNPQLDTLLKILATMNMKLIIVPLDYQYGEDLVGTDS
ncbi:MAG: helix-turn-helix transcriptional regulator [Desulfovibrionaceae bacterium]|nr:helix-turn-helix transcriptional regulator [Desulfovibrionaceae bacterium]